VSSGYKTFLVICSFIEEEGERERETLRMTFFSSFSFEIFQIKETPFWVSFSKVNLDKKITFSLKKAPRHSAE
jgi:hypothetical protein